MQPFQKESQVTRGSGEGLLDTLKYGGASAIGGGLATVASKAMSPLISKVGAFLSPYLPEDLARKGIAKVSPKIGKFVDQAMENGADFEEVKNFIGEKISKQPQEDKNIIQKYSPDLHMFVDQLVKKGTNVLEAGAKARLNKDFDKIITKMEKEHKSPWSSILEATYGKAPVKEIMAQDPSSMQNSAQQQQQQGGQGQEALMAIMNKINQKLGQ